MRDLTIAESKSIQGGGFKSVVAKIALRAVPVVGQALAVYEAARFVKGVYDGYRGN